jgi:heterodisulfide reductase subunit A-like polyferredoxin
LNFLATALGDEFSFLGSVILLSIYCIASKGLICKNNQSTVNTTLNMASKTNRYKVVVVGAGSAGLQCARTMQSDFGVPAKDVLVLEARSTVGGRIQQIDTFIPGHKVELGAEVCLINEYLCFVNLSLLFFHVFFFFFF